jgi:tetratricopeptide (TPR) repeat protein
MVCKTVPQPTILSITLVSGQLTKRFLLMTLLSAMTVAISMLFPCVSGARHSDAGYLKQYTQYIEQCLSYLQQGRHEQVIETAQQAIKLAPDEPRAYNYLSLSYAATGNYPGAVDASQTYIHILEARKALTINVITRHADFVKLSKGKDAAVRFLEAYRKEFPGTIDAYIAALKSSK